MLNKQDTGALKGLAILCIAIHNFCHWLPMAVHENEYVFRLEDSFKLLHYVENFRPHVLLNIFSHFGHYGVPVFLFLSGYGLVCKYERSTPGGLMAGAPSPAPDGSSLALPGAAQFVRTHIVKLWQLMLPALLLFVITQFAFRGSFEKEWSWALRLVTFTANLFPTVNMILGPWWFFSLILQCYLLYRFVFARRRSSGWLWGVTALTLLLQMGLYATDFHFEWNGETVYALEYYRYNAPGHLLAFAFGLEAARLQWTFPLWMAPVGVVLTVVSAFNVWLWFFSPIFAVLGTVPWIQLLRRSNVLYTYAAALGGISAAVFAFHPIVRHYLIIPASDALKQHQYVQLYGVICLYLVLTLAVALLYRAGLRSLKRKSGSRP